MPFYGRTPLEAAINAGQLVGPQSYSIAENPKYKAAFREPALPTEGGGRGLVEARARIPALQEGRIQGVVGEGFRVGPPPAVVREGWDDDTAAGVTRERRQSSAEASGRGGVPPRGAGRQVPRGGTAWGESEGFSEEPRGPATDKWGGGGRGGGGGGGRGAGVGAAEMGAARNSSQPPPPPPQQRKSGWMHPPLNAGRADDSVQDLSKPPPRVRESKGDVFTEVKRAWSGEFDREEGDDGLRRSRVGGGGAADEFDGDDDNWQHESRRGGQSERY